MNSSTFARRYPVNTSCSEKLDGNLAPAATPTRRDILKHSAIGFGHMAFSILLAGQAAAGQQERAPAGAAPADASNPLAPRIPHFRPAAKRIIFLFMKGGPSHLDTFDFKPQLQKAEQLDAILNSDKHPNHLYPTFKEVIDGKEKIVVYVPGGGPANNPRYTLPEQQYS